MFLAFALISIWACLNIVFWKDELRYKVPVFQKENVKQKYVISQLKARSNQFWQNRTFFMHAIKKGLEKKPILKF